MISGEPLSRHDKTKKKTIKGVLSKNDLTEGYKVQKKKSRRVSSGDLPPIISKPVQAVQFKEAVLEDLVPKLLNNKDEYNERQRKISTGRNNNFDEVIRRISTVESYYNLSTHNPETTPSKHQPAPALIHHKPAQSTLTNPIVEVVATAGYEPNGSLVRKKKKQSAEIQQETSYDTSGGLNRRRRSSVQPKDEEKKPEESVGRRRWSAVQSTVQPKNEEQKPEVITAPGRRRRSGAGLIAPELRENRLRTKKMSLPLLNTTKKQSPPRSPTSAQSQRVTFFIPEDEAVGKIPTAASPSVQRLSRMSPAISCRTPSPLSPPQKNRTCSTKKLTQNDKQHANATRYWEWLLFNSTYSWQSFNTDKVMCY